MIASFPDIALSVEDIYWMGNDHDGYSISIRWGSIGTHKGNGSYGPPTDKECYIWGITQWHIENNKIIKEWTVFNDIRIAIYESKKRRSIKASRTTGFAALLTTADICPASTSECQDGLLQ